MIVSLNLLINIQAIIASEFLLKKYLPDNKGLKSKIKIVDWAPSEKKTEINFIMSRKTFNEFELKKWNRLVKGMVKGGTIRKILRKYFSDVEINRNGMTSE